MTLLNLTRRIVVAVAAMASATTVFGEVYHPFAQPVEVDPDWQFFAPVDIDAMTEVHPRKRDPHGWFCSYDRTYLWVSRPDVEQSSNIGDFGYGNRWDLGVMSEDNKGWLFSFRSLGGPNTYDRIGHERIDRQNGVDTGDPNNPVFPPSDRNDPELAYRIYVAGDSLNVIGLTNFELNRTWRFEPYRYGGRLEPMLGFKYSTMNDTALNETYARETGPLLSTGGQAATLLQERFTSFTTNTKNQMVGGQLGARYFRQLGRITTSAEFRAFGMANFQTRRFHTIQYVTEYAAVGGVVNLEQPQNVATLYNTNSTFVFGFEARAEAAYQVTEALNIRGGVDVLNFAQGIWRGANPQFGGDPFNNNQSVEMAGFSLGLSWNR